MVYKVVYTRTAQKDLNRLDQAVVQRILKKIEYFMKSKNPLGYAKKLKNFLRETYRFRVGDYRIIFRIDQKKKTLVILIVLTIVHRKDAYE